MRISDQKHRLPDMWCHNCGKKQNGATGIDADEAPTPGDFSVCLYCGEISAYADDLTLRSLTDDEIVEIAGDERIIAMQKARARAQSTIEDS
jgi:hypothetical protein